VLRGEADFATVAETPFMFAVMNGSKIAIIATIQGSNRTDAILARRDKGISTPQDLKGKRIAVPLGTTADYFLDAFLAVNSMTKKDVVVVDLKPEQMPLALVKGDVDAASTWAPVLEQTQRELGDEAVTFYEEDIYTQTFNLVASSEQVRTYPGRIRKLLSALVEAGKFAAQQPGDAQKSIADYRKFDAQVLSSIWGDHSLEVSLNQALLLALEDESLWAIRNEQTSAMKIPNYLDFLYLDGLQAVKPEAVRIVR
jgi:NitT/TauT family transport system substrate-binding protein